MNEPEHLVELDRKFITDVAEMNPKAAAYFRQRPYLSPGVCQQWRMGYLPRDSGGDRVGGTMRGKIVYPMLNEQGEPLAWFGRDPEHEEEAQEVGCRQQRRNRTKQVSICALGFIEDWNCLDSIGSRIFWKKRGRKSKNSVCWWWKVQTM